MRLSMLAPQRLDEGGVAVRLRPVHDRHTLGSNSDR
jgi:hypothetical protein